MKALSVKPPYAFLIVKGIKDIENRTKRTHFRGKIYIHASAKGVDVEFSTLQTADLYIDNIWYPGTGFSSEMGQTSAIIGEVEIIDCVQNHHSIWAENSESGEKPIWNWVLANPILYEKPILNVKGKLSFWEPDIDIVKCIGCSQKFDRETMKEDDANEKYCTECWEDLSPIMAQEAKEIKTEEDKKALRQFGKVETICQSVYNYEFLITEGFSQKANNTFECMLECIKIAEGYPYVKKCTTEENKFHLILSKEKK